MSKRIKLGIAGMTTTGKSTIADAILDTYRGTKCCIDDYYFTKDFPMIDFHGRQVIDWETPDCIHWDQYEPYVQRQEGKFIIIDSYLLFYSKKIVDSLDALIICEYENTEEHKQIALKRRLLRYFDTEEIPDDYKENPLKSEINLESAYFTEYAWKWAFDNPQYREPKEWHKPILRLSAVAPLKENIEKAKEFVAQLFKQ